MSMSRHRKVVWLAAALALGLFPLVLMGPHRPALAQGTAKNTDPFGEQVTLTAKPIVASKGTANWDNAYETLVEALKQIYGYLDKQGIKPSGPAMTVYLSTDDTGFQFQIGVPVAEEPKDPPKGDIAMAQSPSGKALKFIHRGSYDSMDNTYEAITNFLDEKKIDAKDLFVEMYVTDPRTTPEDKLVIEVYVPTK
jgi:effector-binding domain-containing protein